MSTLFLHQDNIIYLKTLVNINIEIHCLKMAFMYVVILHINLINVYFEKILLVYVMTI